MLRPYHISYFETDLIVEDVKAGMCEFCTNPKATWTVHFYYMDWSPRWSAKEQPKTVVVQTCDRCKKKRFRERERRVLIKEWKI